MCFRASPSERASGDVWEHPGVSPVLSRRLANRLARVLKETTNAEHVYAFVFGDGVPHLHVHLAPRYPNTPHEFWGARLSEWPDAPRVGEQEMRELVTRLGEHLART